MNKKLTSALGLALIAAKDMNLDIQNMYKIIGDLDDLSAQGAYDYLDNRIKSDVIIVGDPSIGEKKGVDIYDIAIKFIEDNYLKARMKKFDEDGYFVIVGSERIK